MRKLLPLASSLALAGIVAPPLLYFLGELGHDALKGTMLAATILWFAVTPFWMNDRPQA
jgi:uncharacterized membrane protein